MQHQGWTIFEILKYAPQHNWSDYEEALKTNPVLAIMMISGVVYSLGDWIAQVSPCWEIAHRPRVRQYANRLKRLIKIGQGDRCVSLILEERAKQGIPIRYWHACELALILEGRAKQRISIRCWHACDLDGVLSCVGGRILLGILLGLRIAESI